MTRDSDTRRMAETGTGSGRSPSSAGRQASPNPLGNSPYPKTVQQLREALEAAARALNYADAVLGDAGTVPGTNRSNIAEARRKIEACFLLPDPHTLLSALESPTPIGEVGEMVARIIGIAKWVQDGAKDRVTNAYERGQFDAATAIIGGINAVSAGLFTRLSLTREGEGAGAPAWTVRETDERVEWDPRAVTREVLTPDGKWRGVIAVDAADALQTIKDEWAAEQAAPDTNGGDHEEAEAELERGRDDLDRNGGDVLDRPHHGPDLVTRNGGDHGK